MEAKLTSISEVALGAAFRLAEMLNPEDMLLMAGHGVDAARAEIARGGDTVGQAYHDLATMSLLACAAYHELNGGS